MIDQTMWMWVLGGACSVIVLLVAFLGSRMLDAIVKIKEELKDFRIEFAETKKDTVTWPNLTDVKRNMEKERETQIKLAMAEHLESHVHEKKAS